MNPEGNVIQEAPLPVWANFRQRALDTAMAEIHQENGLEDRNQVTWAIKTSAGDLGEFCDQGVSSTKSVTEPVKSRAPTTSARLPDFVDPMKAKLVDSVPTGSDWIYELKFDGYRLWHFEAVAKRESFRATKKDLGGKFPEVKDSIAALDVQDVIIDGEIVALYEKPTSDRSGHQ
jgi:bifunctional non-homologous end joining protein LigD